MTELKIPRIVIGGTSSGAGKTVFSIGLMRALKTRGMEVAPFKVGPDYIDPMYHKAAVGRPSRNLDGFMMNASVVLKSFARGYEGADIAVVEGVMGLFDSHDSVDEKGSTAQIAKILGAPVILVADVERIARTAAAFAHGFKSFDENLNIAGVVLNRVGSTRHKRKVKTAIERLAGLEVVGALPKDALLHVPERHLGLVPIHEVDEDIATLASFVEEHVDLGRILEIAKTADRVRLPEKREIQNKRSGKRIGVVYDSAFRFYYAETLSQISSMATPVFIDALEDKKLPEVDVLYIGGGFPEVFVRELEKNTSLRNDIYEFCASGNKVYGECGGLMYLGKKIVTKEGEFEMVGFLPITTEMQNKYVGMGYTINHVEKDNPLSRRGEVIVGHEFHHSRVKLNGKAEFVYRTERGVGIDGKHDGIMKNNVLASYMHVHPLGYRDMVKNLIS
ncbi:MAG: cobyrinate a,c-diamide synthase [Candidatus Hydrothermarchaeales archaeon]